MFQPTQQQRGRKPAGKGARARPAASQQAKPATPAAAAAAAAPLTQREQRGQPAVRDADIYLPGDRIPLDPGVDPQDVMGDGTDARGGALFACVAGVLTWKRDRDGNRKTAQVSIGRSLNVTPTIGSTILGRVTEATATAVTVDIGGINGIPVAAQKAFSGTIRVEDALPDPVQGQRNIEAWKCFRAGDIVRAEVIGFGDRRSYQLSTLRPENGVVAAVNTAGEQMMTVGPSSVQCPSTGRVEQRKVAVHFDESLWWTR
eukprot:TRINITY_DN3549_c0_g1_i1.p1 TRINITY_DN3549_c0_g1~~TRINITY_DN3549_c0_g1_i1.p1  ORF type:complete len:283 (+),score=94.57 TRINITY_DN3549_c0_g1_i1:75-851(+)